MFNNVTQNYNQLDATMEILIIVIVAWGIWFTLGWLLKRCKHAEKTLPVGKTIKIDNLKVVEWVDPKIEKLLNNAGIYSFKDLANTHYKDIKTILEDAGIILPMHNPKTWADQASLAEDRHWGELKEYQDLLIAGTTWPTQ